MNDQQILRSIGALEEAVKNLAAVATRMDDRAIDERNAIYDRVDEIKKEISQLTTKVASLSEAVNEIGPKVDELEEDHFKSLGFKNFGKLAWGIIISTATVAIALVGLILRLH